MAEKTMNLSRRPASFIHSKYFCTSTKFIVQRFVCRMYVLQETPVPPVFAVMVRSVFICVYEGGPNICCFCPEKDGFFGSFATPTLM